MIESDCSSDRDRLYSVIVFSVDSFLNEWPSASSSIESDLRIRVVVTVVQ